MISREVSGYELDQQHLERLSKAVARDLRIPARDLYKFHGAVQTITRVLRPYLKAAQTKGKRA